METVGVIGPGRIGLPIADNLIKNGYRVLGYRRGDMTDFEKVGGIPASSPAEIGAQVDIVLSCVPTSEAVAEVMQGKKGLLQTARPGQIIVELGSHPVPDKQSHVAPFAAKGAAFLDGEVSGTPGMVTARKAVVFLGGDEKAAKDVEPVMRGFTDSCVYFGPFGSASRVKLINNLLVAIHIAATAEAMALGRKAGRRHWHHGEGVRRAAAAPRPSSQSERRGWPSGATSRRRARRAALAHYFPMIEEFAAVDRQRDAVVRPCGRSLSARFRHRLRRQGRRRDGRGAGRLRQRARYQGQRQTQGQGQSQSEDQTESKSEAQSRSAKRKTPRRAR